MNVSVSPAHRAERRAEIRSHSVENGFAESQPSGAVPNQWREHIAFAEGNSNGNTQCPLPATEKNTAVNFAGAIKTGELVVQHPRQQHEAESSQAQVTKIRNIANQIGRAHV